MPDSALSRTAVAENIVLPLYVDINVGMNRTGILPGAAALWPLIAWKWLATRRGR